MEVARIIFERGKLRLLKLKAKNQQHTIIRRDKRLQNYNKNRANKPHNQNQLHKPGTIKNIMNAKSKSKITLNSQKLDPTKTTAKTIPNHGDHHQTTSPLGKPPSPKKVGKHRLRSFIVSVFL